MIHCKDCDIGLEDCDFCIYAIHDSWKDEKGENHLGPPIKCMLHTEIPEDEIAVCDDFHCFRANIVGRKEN